MASSPYPNPNPNLSRIPRESFYTAIDALLKWIRAQPKHQKSQLFEPDDVLYLIVTLARIPSKGRTNPYRIPIPHPVHPFDPQSTSICLLLDDRPSSPLLPSAALDQIRTRNLPIASVIGLADLKSDYRPYESRRKLCDSYDLFFADRKILPLLPRLLGKHFFKRKKIPLAVDSSRPGWAEQIKSWCESSLLYLRTGTCAGLKIGRVTQTKDEIVENAMVVIEGAMELVPKKWGNLRSVHVKTVQSVALPVYQAMPEIGLKIEGIWDEKGGSFAKGKKRGVEEKKGKKKRIHDVGMPDGDGGDGDGEVVSEDIDDGNSELEGEIREEEDELMMDGNDDVANEEKGVNFEVVEKGKKKSGKEGGKAKKGKRGVDEEDGGEQNGVGELNEKKTKKQKKMELEAVVASDITKKSKVKKKKRDDNVVLNDDEQEEAIDELGMEEGMKKKKLKNGKELEAVVASDITKKSKPKKKKRDDNVVLNDDEQEEAIDELGMEGMKIKKLKNGKGEEGKRGGAQEGVGEENGESKLSGIKKKKLQKDATVASDGIKKTKLKVVKKGKKSARHMTD